MNKLYNYLAHRLKSNKLTSSWIITSNNLSSALEELTQFVNQELLKNTILLENNPDVCIVQRAMGSRDISIDQVRELIQFFQKTAGISEVKIAIIIEPELMNIFAANACLKILEEAKFGNYIFLLTKNPLALMPTIRSRCLLFNIPDDSYIVHSEQYIKFVNTIIDKQLDVFTTLLQSKNRELWLELTDYSLCLLMRIIKKAIGQDINLLEPEKRFVSLALCDVVNSVELAFKEREGSTTDCTRVMNDDIRQFKSSYYSNINRLYKKLAIVYRLTQNTIKYDLELVSSYIILLEELTN
jgi:DNA polymerase-3 subunit delta'